MNPTATTNTKTSYPQGKAGGLNEDQRRLLVGIGGWLVLGALTSDHGLAHLVSGHTGGTQLGHGMNTGAWERQWWQAASGKVILGVPWNPPLVTITRAEIKAHAKTIDPALMAELTKHRRFLSSCATNRISESPVSLATTDALLRQALLDPPAPPAPPAPAAPRDYAPWAQMELW